MKNLFLAILLLFSFSALSQGDKVWLHPNRGQWDDRIAYSVELSQGEMFIESNGFAYHFSDIKHVLGHQHDDHTIEKSSKTLKGQVIRSTFLESTWKGERVERDSSYQYRNYFLGTDSTKWKSKIHDYSKVELLNYYPQTNLIIEGEKDYLKYSFIAKPGADIGKIRYQIEGASDLFIDPSGNLHIVHRFGEIIEEKPIAWSSGRCGLTDVPVNFKLKGNVLGFEFPNGYNLEEELIIDPQLTFSSFTGSTMDNWGMTAAPDENGNLYAGGIVFAGSGSYPTTPGVYDATFNGGASYTIPNSSISLSGFDAAITKFSADGSNLIYSTYLGGSGNEAPHSLVTDKNGNLYIMGVTSSNNFPTSAGCYDPTYNGGPSIVENELGYAGADLFITAFNANGTGLIGSTFLGGSGTDGVNIGALNYNYGDSFRGEIIVGGDGNIYVTSTTRSQDYPTKNPQQSFLNGLQDAVVTKLTPALNSIIWSTFLGGNGIESGNSIQYAKSGDVYVAGGTSSSNFIFPSGNDQSYNGGSSDGYLVRLGGASGSLISGTYLGLGGYDQAYFVQLDTEDKVYTYGQTDENWGVSSGKYGKANSGQFIRKYSTDLKDILWTTMIGAGTGYPEISPTAFLVSNCFDIFISGWGGKTNQGNSSQAKYSTTNGFETTLDAFQTITNGNNFYIAVLNKDAQKLKYATFMGGTSSSSNHVDGGTSRFDKMGRIYHAVCGACGGNANGFTTTPGVWSPTNKSTNCNLAAFKFELSNIEILASSINPVICLPNPVIFNSSSVNGNTYFWDFGDGATSTEQSPTHYYSNTGVYTATLTVSDSFGCFSPATKTVNIEIKKFDAGIKQPSDTICPNQPFQLEAYGGSTYSWTPTQYLSNALTSNPTASITNTTTFSVQISDQCGSEKFEVTLPVYTTNVSVTQDTSLCIGQSVQLQASGGISYNWSPSTYLDNPLISSPTSNPDESIEYTVSITTKDDCLFNESVSIFVLNDLPLSDLLDSTAICKGNSVNIQINGGVSYYWYPNQYLNTQTGPSITVNPPDDITYYCDLTNACGTVTDSVFVDVIFPSITASIDTTICPGEKAYLSAIGGASYQWEPNYLLENSTLSSVVAFPKEKTQFVVVGTDEIGCSDYDSVLVDIFPNPYIKAFESTKAHLNDKIQLSVEALNPSTYTWSPTLGLSCANCPDPIAEPNQNITYIVEYTDSNSCTATDSVRINYEGTIYIPNTFTPDGNGLNELFMAIGPDVRTFELMIFDRWGELIHTMKTHQNAWDGTYKGALCKEGTYIWKINYSDFLGNKFTKTGHVNLLR